MQYTTKRRLIVVISVVLLFAIYLLGRLSFLINIAGVIFGLAVFYTIDHLFEIKFKLRHYLYVILILFGGILFSPLYFISTDYDKILHFVMPILGSIMIFFVVDKLKIKFQWKLLITFTSILAILTIHEIGEYLIDKIWDLKLQGVYLRDISGFEKFDVVQGGLEDTMFDLIFGMLGSLFFSISKTICYLYNKRYKKIKKNKIKRSFLKT